MSKASITPSTRGQEGSTADDTVNRTKGKGKVEGEISGYGDVNPEYVSGVRRSADNAKEIDLAVKALITSQIRAPFCKVEEGIINLLRECLISEKQGISTGALSGHCEHYESVHDDDFGWGCGWRNIQILSSFMLSQREDAREAFFHGVGFVPDISALQRWLEIAWMKGFDSSGAEYYNWQIYGTRKWIGTTECAALLRSFGIRAMIVSFTARSGDQSETAVGGLAGAFGGAQEEPSEGDERSITKINSHDNEEVKADETVGYSSPNIDRGNGGTATHGSSITGLLDQFYDLCCNCMEKLNLSSDTEHEFEHGVVTDKSGMTRELNSAANCGVGAAKKYDPECGEVERERGGSSVSDSHSDLQSSGCGEEAGNRSFVIRVGDMCCHCSNSVLRKANNSGGTSEHGCFTIRNVPASRTHHESLSVERQECESGSNKGCNGLESKQSLRKINKGGNGDPDSSWQQSDDTLHHHHLVQWVWSYFAADTSDLTSPGHNITMSHRSPLYFQHRGHSRTIVGVEHRQLSSDSDEINLLVLDPSQSTEDLAKALRSKTGWRELIAHDIHKLKQSEYQICYVEEGIAHGEELENLKVLKSLNYSFY